MPPSDMATTPSAAVANDVRGPARGEVGGIHIKLCWIWTEVGRRKGRTLSICSKLARGRGASCRRDLRGFGLLPAAGLATLPAANRICATYLVRRSRPQQRVVDEMPPALHNADPISDDGRTAGAAASSTGWEPAARPSEVLGAAAIAREQGWWRPEVVRRRAEAVQRGRGRRQSGLVRRKRRE